MVVVVVAAPAARIGSTRPLTHYAQAAEPDSLAAAARAHYREGARFAETGDLKAAREAMAKAHRAWPTQPAYLIAAARLSAQLADTAGTAHWLGVLAELGAAVAIDERPDLASLAGAPALTQVVAKLRSNGTPLARSKPIVTDLAADFYPEGIDFDPIGNRFLVASVRLRTIASVAPNGRSAPFLLGADSADAVLGVRVDGRRDLVWATTRGLPQQQGFDSTRAPTARVIAVRRSTGTIVATAALPDDGKPHWLGDLVVDHQNGDVYLSDSESPVIFRASLRDGRIVVDEFARHRYFRSLQGLAIDPKSRRLYVADYSHGLMTIGLGDRQVRYLPPPAGATALGIDGLSWQDGALLAVQNGVAPPRVVRIMFDQQGAIAAIAVVDRHLPQADEPTIGTIANGHFVYVGNSQWEKYDDSGKRRPGTTLAAPVLLSLPLTQP